MAQHRPWRVTVLGWGNLVIGALMPVGAFINVLAALRVFSVEWAGDSIILTMLLGLLLGYLSWSSGRAILQSLPRAFNRTCSAGGMIFGYTIAGILEMATSGRDRSLLLLIRHGSENWWDWSFSHFQNSVLREIPLLAWWVLGVGTVLRHPLPGGPVTLWDRATLALGQGFCFSVIGMAARGIHIMCDHGLSSQR